MAVVLARKLLLVASQGRQNRKLPETAVIRMSAPQIAMAFDHRSAHAKRR